jgi:hypothetical protein
VVKSPPSPSRKPLPTRRRKDNDIENDRNNGLRIKNKMTMKDKRFIFSPVSNKRNNLRKTYDKLAVVCYSSTYHLNILPFFGTRTATKKVIL